MELEQALQQTFEQFPDHALELFLGFLFLVLVILLAQQIVEIRAEKEVISELDALQNFESYKHLNPQDLIKKARSQEDPVAWALDVLSRERRRQEVESQDDYEIRLFYLRELADLINEYRTELSQNRLKAFEEALDYFDKMYPNP